ncbi:hypothetical protein BFP70_15570 [Thioclava sp. SK-1]|nr:hypothetical protein BFP70_15570 [Thioclava sp. SK-1]
MEDGSAENGLPLIAIGASAGGLEPLEAFFEHIPDDSGWCCVVIQHLSPDYRSMMAELLARKTTMAIKHIEDGLPLEPNTIFINRASTQVRLEGDVFRTRPYASGDPLPNLPIDTLFQSLTTRDPDRTIAVLLSGAGSDGARGAQSLYAAECSIFVQSPGEAAFPSMLRAALAAGAVDRVLPAADMPKVIAETLKMGRSRPPRKVGVEQTILAIVKLLETSHHVDFSAYKTANVERRIIRRQQLRNYDTLSDYLEVLQSNPAALDELYRDLLIGVTEFYRDPDSIAVLRRAALEKLVDESGVDTPLRIWVPGCASGEEAYTIAIELAEVMRERGVTRKSRVIATDVHRHSIDIASAGVYSVEALQNVPPEIRERYFSHHRGQYIVDPQLRQKVVFSVHDVLSDPPYMHLDLISCRNLMIYLKEQSQSRVISMFLFGLRREGFLLLGPSESLGKFAQEFDVIDSRWRLFQKNSHHRVVDRSMFPTKIGGIERSATTKADAETQGHARRIRASTDMNDQRNRDSLIRSYDALLKRYAPSSILITAEGTILSWFGAAAAFIDTMNNLANWTVEEIIHRDLQFPINVAMEKLRQNALVTYSRRLEIELVNGTVSQCIVTIEPLETRAGPKLMLVQLQMTGENMAAVPEDTVAAIAAQSLSHDDQSLLNRRVHELERDLRLTEETLQHVTERLEASSEELQASNEELQASNEELQASNEELQSSNEELHAVNEALISVTAEHEQKIGQMIELNQGTEHVFAALNIGVIFVTAQNQIGRFSALTGQIFGLEPQDIGRGLDVVGPRLDFVDLIAATQQVLTDQRPQVHTGTYRGSDMSVSVQIAQFASDTVLQEGDTPMAERVVLIFSGGALTKA